MRHRVSLVFALVAALCVAGSAFAIVGGTPDNRTIVGGAIQRQVHNGVSGFERCTGVLIGPTHFVTAAHCFEPGGAPIMVTFDQTLSPSTSHFVTGTIAATFGDVAVLTLSEAQPAWATLPELNASQTASTVDLVGYGVEGLDPKKAPTGFGTRLVATTSVKSAGNESAQSLKLLADPGACFGDSGGPNFLSGTNIVLAITSAGMKNCNGISFSQRLDTAEALAFLAPFVNS
jgi:hypothetical protein